MIIVNIIQEITAYPSIIHSYDGSEIFWDFQNNWMLLAQQSSDPDIIVNFHKAFNNFIQTGQAWALLIGLIIGYMIRGFTSCG